MNTKIKGRDIIVVPLLFLIILFSFIFLGYIAGGIMGMMIGQDFESKTMNLYHGMDGAEAMGRVIGGVIGIMVGIMLSIVSMVLYWDYKYG